MHLTRPTLAMAAATLLFCVLEAASPATAAACSCMQQTPAQAFERADAAFEGRVDGIQPLGSDPAVGPTSVQVTLHVVRTWKGADAEDVVVRTAGDTAACGYPFEEGQTYLVYATAGGETLQVSLCSRTQPIEEADEDLEALGLATVPVDADEEPSEPDPETSREAELKSEANSPPSEKAGCASCRVAGSAPGTTAVFALLLSSLWIRRGRARRSTRRTPPPS